MVITVHYSFKLLLLLLLSLLVLLEKPAKLF